MAVHELPRVAPYLHGYFSPDLEPVLEVDAGDSVLVSTPNNAWLVAPGEAGPRRSLSRGCSA